MLNWSSFGAFYSCMYISLRRMNTYCFINIPCNFLSYIISCLLYIIQFAIPQMTQYAVYTTWYCDGQASNFIHICLILIYCLIWICTLSFFSGCWSAIQKLCMHDAYYEVTKSFYCSLFHFQKIINLFIQLYFCFQCCS